MNKWNAGPRAMTLSESPYVSGLKELLNILDKGTIEALAITATNHRIMPENKKEAIELVLHYTENLARLFSYKRMTSQVLVEYLHKRKVPMRNGVSKTELIELVRGELEKSVKGKRASTNTSITKAVVPVTRVVAQDVISRTHATTVSPLQTWPAPAPASPSMNLSLTTNPNTSFSLNINTATANMSLDVRQAGSVGGGSTDDFGGVTSEVFARELCTWFYTMVNRLQPEASHLQGDIFTAETFVANSSVDVFMYVGQQQVREKHGVGQQDAFTTLRDVLLECAVCFSPNMDTGIHCEMTSFGMAKVQCCGTLHRSEALVGLFEQEFGLVRCPVGKWKIMITRLNLKQTRF